MLRMFPNIADLLPIMPVAGELFDYIESSFFKVIYTDFGGEEMLFYDAWRMTYPDLAKDYAASPEGKSFSKRRYLLEPIKIR